MRTALRCLGLVAGLGGSGCGVLFGDPVELFPAKSGLDGGAVDLRSPCIEQVERVSGQALTIVGAPAANMAALVEGVRTSELVWPGVQPPTEVTVALSGVQVFSVMSRINESYAGLHQAADCSDHVRIDAHLVLTTADGRLNETVQAVSFVAFENTEAQSEVVLARAAIEGKYAPAPFGQQCFVSTTFHLLAGADQTSGAMIDEFSKSCDQADAGVVSTLAGGHWGTRWRH
ncbi:MAG: hypothetical protein JWN04_4734 [Myxococcaceae bacterium]|nr:hypothetical protein [Myxococcaceae bacterium]